jgi:hypothetical protein
MTRIGNVLAAAVIASCELAGCAVLGPASIKRGRAAYSEAIMATNNQQILAMIVEMRYGLPSGLLAVTSVTANLNIQSNVGSEFGIGSDSSYEGNLTPLSAGIAYEENPTISYTPIQGEDRLRQLMSPLPLDLTLLVLDALGSSPQVMTLLCRSINGIHNPDFKFNSTHEADPRFGRIAALLADLHRGGHIAWTQDPDSPRSFALALSGEGTAYAQQVRELYDLLGFEVPRDLHALITLPVHLGIGKPRGAAIQLRTRSLWDLFGIAAASVEVPAEHIESGLAPVLPAPGAVGNELRVRRSKRSPTGAMIAVKRHGWWYYIDQTDTPSKMTFRLLEALMSARMAEAADTTAAPVLTVPVSR